MFRTIQSGNAYPLGATLDSSGANFSIFSEFATGIELCLFSDVEDAIEYARYKITEVTDHIWHIHLSDIVSGQLYGYRVHGPYLPEKGHRFNANKLLVDPYAKAISGSFEWNDALFGYNIKDLNTDLSFNKANSAPFMPKSVIIDDKFNWGIDQSPNTSMEETKIHEIHIGEFTKSNLEIPKNLRGTFSGLKDPSSVLELKKLGVTAVALLPIHHFLTDVSFQEKGICDYWRYNTVNFFSPAVRYSSRGFLGEQVKEFKEMVKTLHQEGLEIILSVVYNHTAEGNHLGPTLSLKGIDNLNYYQLVSGDKRYYVDHTRNCNTLNMMGQAVKRLIVDSLQYWITEMHVDGFSFDLGDHIDQEINRDNNLDLLLEAIRTDPVISKVKLFTEGWDSDQYRNLSANVANQ